MRVVGEKTATTAESAVKSVSSGQARHYWSRKVKEPFRVEVEDAGDFANDRARGSQGFRI